MTTAVSALATVARATPTYSGSRSTSSPGQLVTDDGWSTSHGGFKIDFAVDWNGSYWTYDYHFYDADGSDLDPHISRFLKLQVSDVEGAWFKLVSDGHTPGYSSGDLIDLVPFDISFHLWDAPPEDPTYGFFGLFLGDDNDNTTDELSDSHVTFISSQGPMWGSFYGRDGELRRGWRGPAEAVNRGIDERRYSQSRRRDAELILVRRRRSIRCKALTTRLSNIGFLCRIRTRCRSPLRLFLPASSPFLACCCSTGCGNATAA